MKYIRVPSGQQVKVDDADYEDVAQFKWHLSNGYAIRHVTKNPDVREYMHRRINKTPKGYVTDHINGDKLDNRRSNLRTATISQNGVNSGKRRGYNNPYRGVSLHTKTGLWRARITVNRKEKTLGYFIKPEEARDCYNEHARANFGNFIPGY